MFADSIDFLEDASINLLVLVSIGWSAQRRAQLGMALAAILLIPGIATLWAIYTKLNVPVPPDPVSLSVTGLGALMVNFSCALMLTRYRAFGGSLTRAAFLSSEMTQLGTSRSLEQGSLPHTL